MDDPQQRQMNVYARFIDEDTQDESTPVNLPPAKPLRAGTGADPDKAGGRSAKPGLKKRGALPK